MGLIKAAISSASTALSDTWKDYFVCEALDADTLMVKGIKKGKNSNDVITNGSGIVVNEGQCAIVVDDGIVVEVANEPGNYTFDTTKSPSVFDGGFKGITDTFKVMIERFTYGGEVNRYQKVYYINTKEIPGNMFGTATPIPFKVKDANIGLNMEVNLKCNGEYSIKITNPVLFFKNVAGNTDYYALDNLKSIMKSDVLAALQPAIGNLSNQGVNMYSDIPLHTYEIKENLNKVLSGKWSETRGIEVVDININSISPKEEELLKIQNIQEGAALRDPKAAAAHLAAAQAQAMRDAANNPNGAVNAFMGVNMSAQSSSAIAEMFKQGEKQQAGGFCPYCGKPILADSLFCSYCGKKVK